MGPKRTEIRRCYVDTSAYLAILLGEDGSDELTRELAQAELCSSVLLVLEATRNLVRFSRAGILAPARLQAALDRLHEDVERFALCEVTLDLCSGPTFPPVTTPCSLDLLHLRTALRFHAASPLGRFVTLDDPQRLAARELGLPV